MTCLVCDDTGWVCENHPDQPWTGPHACTYGGAGALVLAARTPPPASRRACRRGSSQTSEPDPDVERRASRAGTTSLVAHFTKWIGSISPSSARAPWFSSARSLRYRRA
jgi:hypothetical protein